MDLEILTASIIGSLLDPIALVGYIICGVFVRNYWGSVASGIAFRFIMHAVLGLQGSQLVPALIGAVIAVSAIFLIARAVREPGTDPNAAPPPSP